MIALFPLLCHYSEYCVSIVDVLDEFVLDIWLLVFTANKADVLKAFELFSLIISKY